MLNALPPAHDVPSPRGLHPFVARQDLSQPTEWVGQQVQQNRGPDTKRRKESTYEQYNRLVEKLYQKVLTMDSSSDKYWVAVAGGPGSGKTTSAVAIAQRLNSRFPNSPPVAVVVPMDGFHIPRDELTAKFGPDALLRRGAPWTFDAPGILEKMRQIKEHGRAVLPTYSRELSNPLLDGVHVEKHHKIIIVEGLYLLHEHDPDWAPLNELWDEKWFVKAPTREIQKERLLKRSLKNWSFAKAKQWGPGEDGARTLMEFNDVKNMDLLEYCADVADETIITE